jgi:hypothetical protein
VSNEVFVESTRSDKSIKSPLFAIKRKEKPLIREEQRRSEEAALIDLSSKEH